jgi:hypothetical protein
LVSDQDNFSCSYSEYTGARLNKACSTAGNSASVNSGALHPLARSAAPRQGACEAEALLKNHGRLR